MNKIKVHMTVVLFFAVLFYLEIAGIFSVGGIINEYFPCKQDPKSSFPCFGFYDMVFMYVTLVIIIIVSVHGISTFFRGKDHR